MADTEVDSMVPTAHRFKVTDLSQEMSAAPVDVVGCVTEFRRKFGVLYDGAPRGLPVTARNGLHMTEELSEYFTATADLNVALSSSGDVDKIEQALEKQLDALVDLVYVAVGCATHQGFDFSEAFRRVHHANMAKELTHAGNPSKRGDPGDIVKPVGWTPPDLSDLVHDNVYSTDGDTVEKLVGDDGA